MSENNFEVLKLIKEIYQAFEFDAPTAKEYNV